MTQRARPSGRRCARRGRLGCRQRDIQARRAFELRPDVERGALIERGEGVGLRRLVGGAGRRRGECAHQRSGCGIERVVPVQVPRERERAHGVRIRQGDEAPRLGHSAGRLGKVARVDGAPGAQRDAGPRESRGNGPRRVPPGAGERAVGGSVIAEALVHEAEQVQRLAVARAEVTRGRPADGGLECLERKRVLAAAEVPCAESGGGAGVTRVTPERLAQVGEGIARRVPILLQVRRGDQKLIGRGDLGRRRGLGRHPRLPVGRVTRPPLDQHDVAVAQRHTIDVGGARRSCIDHLHEGRGGGERAAPLPHLVFADGGRHREPVVGAGDCDADPRAAGLRIHGDRRIRRRLSHGARSMDRVPVLTEALGLTGQQPGEVGLIVGEDTGHELDVRTVGVGQLRIPCAADLAVPPGPLLLAGRDRRIGPVHEAGVGGVIVSAEERVVGVGDHVRRGHGNVAVHIDAVGVGALRGQRRVVHAVVRPIRSRERRYRASRVICDVGHVVGEE